MNELKRTGPFGVEGTRIVFHNKFSLFGDEPVNEAPRTVLAQVYSIDGNYGTVISAHEVAGLIVRLLNGDEEKISLSLSCMECGAPVVWVRHTQFAGEHPYCKTCAEKEEDFGREEPGSFVWREIR